MACRVNLDEIRRIRLLSNFNSILLTIEPIPGKVLALGGAGRARPRVLPLAAAKVQVAGGRVADTLRDLVIKVHGYDAPEEDSFVKLASFIWFFGFFG